MQPDDGNPNRAIWDALYKSDPAHVKPITGKSYKGHSPKPHWVIMRLTEQFGPAGKGFGWTVLHSVYLDSIPRVDGVEKRHECRIRFWWKDEDGEHSIESAGGTKALYKAKVNADGTGGYWTDDEDAEKKSLTDAITKAASWLGVAGDIFMGQWNDSKYQAELLEEARAKDAPKIEPRPASARNPVGDAEPPYAERQARRELGECKTLADLKVKWGWLYANHREIASGLESYKDDLKDLLTNPPRQEAPPSGDPFGHDEVDAFGLPPVGSGRAA